MSQPGFFDTNAVLYLLSADTARADRSEELLGTGGIVSVQVLNETVSVARRKMRLSWPEVDELLGLVKASCEVVPLTLQGHELALRIATRHQLSISRCDDLCIGGGGRSGHPVD